MRTQMAAANWKMNLTLPQAKALLTELLALPLQLSNHQLVVLGIPFPYLMLAKEMLQGRPQFYVAAQNCSHQLHGAYTGETSVDMLHSIGVDYVIVGHSERREYYQEDNQLLAKKMDTILAKGLRPIFCCGEALAIREAATQNPFVATQLAESLFHLTEAQMLQTVIAYEPIWAIGTGKTATTAQAQDMHLHIRQTLASQYGDALASQISILYGGSVKPNNAAEIFAAADVDGGLVGGASLVAKDFGAIVEGLGG